MSSTNPSNSTGPNDPDPDTQFHIVVSPIPADAPRPRIEDRQPDAAGPADEPFNPYTTAQPGQAQDNPSADQPDPASWSAATASIGPGFAARFARFSVPRKKPWWFWPVAFVALVLSIILALLAVALIIILAVPILLFVLIRAWIRGFMPLRSGRGGGGGGGADAGLRQNVRVLTRRGNT
ncbi:MAG: hypothetical protein IBJ18_08210 [Phycisphaerales bacterium]|nr:hypothetical protein [Phycisphaerales bacterium]